MGKLILNYEMLFNSYKFENHTRKKMETIHIKIK